MDSPWNPCGLWRQIDLAAWILLCVYPVSGKRGRSEASIQRHQSKAQCVEQSASPRCRPHYLPERLWGHSCVNVDRREPQGRLSRDRPPLADHSGRDPLGACHKEDQGGRETRYLHLSLSKLGFVKSHCSWSLTLPEIGN